MMTDRNEEQVDGTTDDAPDEPGGAPAATPRDSGQGPIERTADALPFAMVITDPHLPDNPIIYVNKAFERITRYTADFAIGRNCRFLQGEDTDPEAVAMLRAGIEARRDVSVDLLNYRADGEAFMNRLLVAPLYDGDGNVTSMLGIQREIPTGERRGNDDPEGEDAERAADGVRRAMRGDGADGGDPLGALRSRVEDHLSMIVGLVRLDDVSPDALPETAPHALGRRIEGLQLLYEELDRSGVANVDDEEVAAGAYLSRVAATLTHLEGRRSVRVNVDCDEVDMPVTTAARLGLLTTELMLNALRHAFPDRREGLVNLEFKVLTGNRARLVVRDDGVGLRGDVDWPYAGEDGAREREARTERRTGHRVGARLVRQLVDALGAEIDVTSGTYGTTIEIGLDLDGLTA